jgi:hypothetical protein
MAEAELWARSNRLPASVIHDPQKFVAIAPGGRHAFYCGLQVDRGEASTMTKKCGRSMLCNLHLRARTGSMVSRWHDCALCFANPRFSPTCIRGRDGRLLLFRRPS